MKIREIISEGWLTEGPDDSENEDLITILLYLKERSEDDAESATLRTDSVIQLVRNAGRSMFDYHALTSAFESDEAVKNLIKTFSKDEITLKSDNDDSEDETFDNEEDQAMNPEDTVQNMAQSAANKRS